MERRNQVLVILLLILVIVIAVYNILTAEPVLDEVCQFPGGVQFKLSDYGSSDEYARIGDFIFYADRSIGYILERVEPSSDLSSQPRRIFSSMRIGESLTSWNSDDAPLPFTLVQCAKNIFMVWDSDEYTVPTTTPEPTAEPVFIFP